MHLAEKAASIEAESEDEIAFQAETVKASNVVVC